MQHTIEPVLHCPLGGRAGIPGIVDLLTGVHGLGALAGPPPPTALDLLCRALTEVLRSVVDLCGEQDPQSAAVELWVEPALAVVTLGFAGPALPDWLVANWDRGEVPARLAPPSDCAWGWLIVREAFDSVSAARAGARQLLFLERRL